MSRPYSEREDLNLSEQRLIELTDSEYAVGVFDEEVLRLRQIEADDMIDAALFGVYAVPFDDTPAIIRLISAALWKGLLFMHRDNMVVPPAADDRYKWAVAQLAMYRDPAEAQLNAPRVSAATDPGLSAGTIVADNCYRVFGRARDSIG